MEEFTITPAGYAEDRDGIVDKNAYLFDIDGDQGKGLGMVGQVRLVDEIGGLPDALRSATDTYRDSSKTSPSWTVPEFFGLLAERRPRAEVVGKSEEEEARHFGSI